MISAKRIIMSIQLAPQQSLNERRTIQQDDAEGLARLMHAAYRGTIDDEGETLNEAREEIHKTFAGEYGRLLSDCSFAIEADGSLISACLVSWYEPSSTPLVAFLMTHPDAKRQGHARMLLRQSMNALLEQGYSKLTLVVSEGNNPAIALYRNLGFTVDPQIG